MPRPTSIFAVLALLISFPAAAAHSPKLTEFVKGLEAPWGLAPAPDGRLFVTEQAGKIRLIEAGKLLPESWMEIDAGYVAGTDTGLFGIALDPDFGSNGFVYVASTYKDGDRVLNRLLRLREVDGKGTLSRVLFDGVPGGSLHNGGRVKIGPDQKLYWTTGDAGTDKLAQDPTSSAGKILRLDLDGGIPADNPVSGSAIYVSGFQNPLGMAWDPFSDRLYATDIGPVGKTHGTQDEINLIEAGKNYGWPVIYGSNEKSGYITPIAQSTIARNWDPASLLFIRGGRWNGSLLFAGLNGQTVYRLTISPRDPRRMTFFEELFQEDYGRFRELAQSMDGTIYVTTSNSDGHGTPSPDGDKVLILTP